MTSALLLYDADCGFCQWCVATILAWDRHQRLRPVSLQSNEAEHLLCELDHSARMASWHLVLMPTGAVYSAGAAFERLLSLLPGGRHLARSVGALPQRVLDCAYRWVAEHRTWFGRPLPQAAKRRASERIAARAI